MIEPTDEMFEALFDAGDASGGEFASKEDVLRGQAAVLAIVERDFLTGCRATVETRGVTVACKKDDDGHDTHLGRSSGWDVVW